MTRANHPALRLASAPHPAARGGLPRRARYHPAETSSVILLDLMMPEMDGFAFAQAVRERQDMRDVPIVVLTAKNLTEEDRQRLRGHVAGILQKQTLTPENLQSQLRAALAQHLPPSAKG